MGGGLGTGDGVARPFDVVNDTYMTGQHIGQVFQQPQRRYHLESIFAPLADVEPAVSGAFCHRRGQLDQIAAYKTCSQIDCRALRIDIDRFGVDAFCNKSAAEDGFVCRGNRQFDISGEQLDGLAVGLRHERLYLEIRDLPGQFAAKAHGVECSNFAYSASAGTKTRPHIGNGQSQRTYRTKAGYHHVSRGHQYRSEFCTAPEQAIPCRSDLNMSVKTKFSSGRSLATAVLSK